VRVSNVAVLIAALCAVRCGDDGSGPSGVNVVVSVATVGVDPDTNGYTVEVSGPVYRAFTVRERLAVLLESGTYDVSLGGITSNCTVAPPNPRPVTIAPATRALAPVETTFHVSCQHVTGAVRVIALLTDGDPSGPSVRFSVRVDGEPYCSTSPFRRCSFTTSVTIPGLQPGEHSFALGLAAVNPPDCSVRGANPRTASVKTAETTDLRFEVRCASAP
jgi:hypothetical protein